jgi:hypothetical protein
MSQIPTAQLWCRVSELDALKTERDAARTQRDLAEAEAQRLRRRVAELENRPLIAVAPAGECPNCAKLQKRIENVRALLKEKMQADGKW